MIKAVLNNDVGLIAMYAAHIGEDMKLTDLEKIVTDEEKMVLGAYARLALAIGELSEAIDKLPD